MNALKKMLNGYSGHQFQSSCGETPEFKTFCTKLKNAMRKEIREDFPDLDLTVWSKGHFDVSGFITRKSDGAIFYFSFRDVRTADAAGKQMYRSAQDLKDYRGGMNRWTDGGNLLAAIAKERYEFAA